MIKRIMRKEVYMANRPFSSAHPKMGGRRPGSTVDRRQFVKAGLAAGASLPSIGGLLSLSGCTSSEVRTAIAGPQEEIGGSPLTAPQHNVSLVAEVGEEYTRHDPGAVVNGCTGVGSRSWPPIPGGLSFSSMCLPMTASGGIPAQ